MKYCSTRDGSLRLDFRSVVSEGLSRDGGLFLPVSFPDVSAELARWRGLSYADLAEEIFSLYSGECLSRRETRDLVRGSLASFRHPEITPLVKMGRAHILELFHGPTYSFKDVALQALGRLFEMWPAEGGVRTVLGATSGDTGSAAIHGVRGRKGMEVFILFPEGRVSPLQELQMTTVPDRNVHCLAVQGSFDDCQALVKVMFSDSGLREKLHLSAVNSINWARIVAQITYYFFGYFRWLDVGGRDLGERLLCSVPTGNFGDVFAGYAAKRMGLPLGKLVIASNENDILPRFFQTGSYELKSVVPTISPSMDIQVSSNFERLLFLLYDGDHSRVVSLMEELRQRRAFSVSDRALERFREDFSALRVGEKECMKTIARIRNKHGYILDPHSAVGLSAAEKSADGKDFMTLATAHPAKFTAAVEKAMGEKIVLPEGLAELEKLPRRKKLIPASVEALRAELLEKF